MLYQHIAKHHIFILTGDHSNILMDPPKCSYLSLYVSEVPRNYSVVIVFSPPA